MLEAVTLCALFVAAVGVFYTLQQVRLKRIGRERLDVARPVEVARPELREWSFPTRYRWAAVLAGLAVGFGLYVFTRWPVVFPLTFGGIALLLAWRLEAWWADRRRMVIESQLADALDLMISTLRAGASVLPAIEAAARESRAPLRGQLEEMLGRIRYGDDPRAVLRTLERRVPLDTFRLFGAAMAVHWEVGGSLAPVLATVGRAVRDRIELSRRIRSMTAQGRLSIFFVLGVTWFIARAVYVNDPERMIGFLSTKIGQYLVVAALVLQALGIAWSSVLTRMKV